jgi:hypothetical protein
MAMIGVALALIAWLGIKKKTTVAPATPVD